MAIEPAGTTIISEIREAIEDLRTCITPIFDVNEKLEAELLGSAVLIEVVDEKFLCTAGHVIEGNKSSTLYFDAPSRFEILEGEFYRSADHDVAVLQLTLEQAEAFQKYTFLNEEEIASQHQVEACEYVEFIGYPETKNRKIYGENKIKGLVQSNGCTVIEATETRVRLNFNRKRNLDAKSKQLVKAPDPHGMSGGAMFGVPSNSDTVEGNPQPHLIGISTDWPKEKLEVYGTSISIVLAIIRDAYAIDLPERLDPKNIAGVL